MDSDRIRILLVVIDEEGFALTRGLLSEIEGTEYELDWEPGYQAVLELTGGCDYDVYLVDYDPGLHTGLDLLKEAVGRGCRAPMILLTGMGDRTVDDAAMRAGAADYLLKGRIDPSQLERSIHYSLSRKRAEIERESLEQQFRQAQKIEAIGKLAGGVAHDFNNLLTAILGYAEIGVIQSPDDGRSRSSFEEIGDAARRAADLMKQLLAFSRGQTQQMSVLDLNDVVRNTQVILRRLIGEDVEQRAVLPSGLWLVKSDPRQLEQVVINLAINARDAMQLGGRIVIETANITLGRDSAEVRTGMSPGRYVVMSVSDNGSGISEDALPHIFEPFFTTKPSGRGTGLGLSTCYGIVQQSSGHITASSKPGAGTTIKIYLPRANGRVSGVDNDETPAFQKKGTERVLLVED
jgi:signal transduction histidine kinase